MNLFPPGRKRSPKVVAAAVPRILVHLCPPIDNSAEARRKRLAVVGRAIIVAIVTGGSVQIMADPHRCLMI